jgi:hypothetical protein
MQGTNIARRRLLTWLAAPLLMPSAQAAVAIVQTRGQTDEIFVQSWDVQEHRIVITSGVIVGETINVATFDPSKLELAFRDWSKSRRFVLRDACPSKGSPA